MKTTLILSSLLSLALPVSTWAASCCAGGKPEPAAPAESAELPGDSLYHLSARFTDETGAERVLQDFAGEPVVLTMFFASCGYACPMLAHDMVKVQATLPPEVRAKVRFVMVSFDPDRDTVEKLAAFKQQVGGDAQWTLMRGEPGDVRTLAMLLGVQFRQEPSGDFSHSNLITVLDAGGAVAHRRTGLQGGLPAVSEALVRLATP